MSKRVLVCGGRDYEGKDAVWTALEDLDAEYDILIIHGGARGADALAGRYADTFGRPCMVFPAAWFANGKSAGPMRNAWMLKYGQPDLVLAFPGGRGTENCVKQAEAAGVEVRRIS